MTTTPDPTFTESSEAFIREWVVTPYWQIALAVVVLAALAIIVCRCRRKCRPVRVAHDEDGEAMITPGALRDLVHLVCEKVGAAGKPRICFNSKGDHLNLLVRVKLFEDQRLDAIRKELRQRILETFQETHGIRVGEVNVLITGFKQRHSRHQAAGPAPAGAREAPPVRSGTPKPVGDPGASTADDDASGKKNRRFWAFGDKDEPGDTLPGGEKKQP